VFASLVGVITNYLKNCCDGLSESDKDVNYFGLASGYVGLFFKFINLNNG